ncbi:MAG: hypothetical protein ACI8RD_004544 [Bacillariaceae sp.]|jgi:hypothetical protein
MVINITISPTKDEQTGRSTEIPSLFPQFPTQQGGLFSVHPTLVSNYDTQSSLAGDDGIIVPPTHIPMETTSTDSTPIKSKTSIEPLRITMIAAFGLVIYIVCIWGVSTIGSQRRRIKEDTNDLVDSNSMSISMCLSEVENIDSLSMTTLEEGTNCNSSTSNIMTREEDKIQGDDYITAEEIDGDTTNHVDGNKEVLYDPIIKEILESISNKLPTLRNASVDEVEIRSESSDGEQVRTVENEKIMEHGKELKEDSSELSSGGQQNDTKEGGNDDESGSLSSEDLEYMYGTLPMDKLPRTPRTSNRNTSPESKFTTPFPNHPPPMKEK